MRTQYGNEDGKLAIHIVTLKPSNNYGGILQAYALQNIVSSIAENAIVSTGYYENRYKSTKKILGYAKRMASRYILRKLNTSNLYPHDESLIQNKVQKFIENNLNIARAPMPYHIAVFIVGSDQVWRSKYTDVANFLLKRYSNISTTRISYAASFGRDDLSEYSSILLKKTARLAKKFDSISVREDSGIALVRKHWGMPAEQHIDPTLLLEKEHYIELIEEDTDNVLPSKGNLFAYVLDRAGDKGAVIDKIANALKLQDFEIMPPKATSRKLFQANPEKYQLPPVTQWLKSFADAEFIVTDSFHGTAFSIIFNKPFIAIGNKERGLTRFSSLLKLFGLEHRLISSASEITPELLDEKIDWRQVNRKVESERKRSTEYLKKHLG